MTSDLFPATCACPDAFEDFWQRYPRKVGKGQARKAYAKALKLDTHDSIMFGLSQQIPAMEATDKQFIPHASTWLNGERWNDEPEEPASPNADNPRADATNRAIAFTGAAIRTPTTDCF